MNKHVVAKVVFGLALSMGAGCADTTEPGDTPVTETRGTSQGLSFDRHDARTLSGSFVDGNATILFSAHALAGERAELELTINGKILGYEAVAATDAHNGFYRVDADTAFDTADIAGAQAALDALTLELGNDVTAMALFEASVPKMAYFIANQKAGADVASFQVNEYSSLEARPKSINDDGRVCIKRTTTVTAYYDNSAGTVFTVPTVVGSDWGTSACGAGNYGCMGRCGGGCNGWGGGWTLDCLEHDVCSHNLCASGGGSDANCGDEYNHASSDIFSSCSGN